MVCRAATPHDRGAVKEAGEGLSCLPCVIRIIISGKILDSKKYILWDYFCGPSQVNAVFLDVFTAQPPRRHLF